MPPARPSKPGPPARRSGSRIAVVAVAALAVAAILAVAISAVASGDDDGSGASPARPPVDRAAYCRAWTQMTPLFVDEALSEDDGDNTRRSGKMRDLLTEGGTPPAEIAGDADYVLQAVSEAAEGDRRSYDAPERQVATHEILSWAHTSCGYTRVEVTYRDFAYDGLPATLPAGPASFEGIQAGNEPHVMQVYRIRDGVTATPEEVLAQSRVAPIPSVQLARTAELVSFGAFTDFDGDPGYMLVDLEPGSYLVICPVPTGVNREGIAPDRAKPHFDNGQVASFTVE